MKSFLRRLAGSQTGKAEPSDAYTTTDASWSNGRSRHASSRSSSGHGLAHGPPHAGARPSSGFLTLQEASQQLNERRDRREAAGAASQTSSGLAPPAGGTRGSRHGPAALAPPEPPAAAAEPRASSLPRPLASGGAGAGAATAGSGPGGPVSPDPAVSAALRRVSSQPPDGLSSDSSLHSSATPAGSAPVDRLRPGASGDADGDGSSSAGSLHIHFGGSGGGDAYGSSGDDAAAAAAGHPGASAALAVTLGSQVPPVPARPPLHQHSHLPARWQPAHDLSVHGHQPHHRQQQQLCVAPSGPHARAPAPASLVAALAAAGDDDDEALVSPAHSGVSLLTYQLRGGSGASSCCTSREASTRGGVARSREASVRSGSRRTPVGGLTLALSRENSAKGGQAQGHAGTASGGPRDVPSPTERSVSSGQRSYRGLALAEPRPDLHTLLQRHAEAAAQYCGCGSADWMGAPPPARLASMLDACDAAGGAAGTAAAALDPFARRSHSRGSSRAPSCRPSAGIPEEEREQLLGLDLRPQDVGSWAQRVTTFDNVPKPAEPADSAAAHAGGPDPLLLTAALEALAAAPGAACAGGSPQGALQCGPQLVGDSELATMTSGEGQSGELHGAHVLPAHGGSWPTAGHSSASAGSHGVSMPALVLSSSWDASETAAATALAGLGRLGGSAPACGTAVATAAAARGLPGSQPAPGVHDDAAAAAAAAAQAAEWSRDFVKRWRTVKKRAYLQALGLRALWQVNSPSDRHEPLELLTNDLPQYDNGMRRAWSVSRLAAQREAEEAAARRGDPSGAVPAAPRRGSAGSLHKDLSLGSLLLGEVAEVC